MNKMTLSQVRDALATTVDSVGFSKKDNCFVAKRTYFYRSQGGGSPERVADAIKAAIPSAAINSATDHWHAWPKDSWFEVRFTA